MNTLKTSYRFAYLLLLSLLIIIFTHSASAISPPISLGIANDYNQFIFSNVTLNDSTAEGKVAYGGTAQLTNVDIATALSCPNADYTLIIGGAGASNYDGGTVASGNAIINGSLTQSNVNFGCGTFESGELLDFGDAIDEITDISNDIGNLKPDEEITEDECELILNAPNSDINFYMIEASRLDNGTDPDNWCALTINAPCGATVLINVAGSPLTMTDGTISLTGGIEPQNVLFNFWGYNFDFTNIDFPGSVLAPRGTINATNMSVDGTLVAYSVSGDVDTFNTTFGSEPSCGFRDYDFGDLPAVYNIVELLSNGARHELNGLYLGDSVDADADGFPSADADGDDNNGSDDEDGIITDIDSWVEGANGGQVTAIANGAGCLNGWIDWNRNYFFTEPDEHVIVNQLVAAGSQDFTFDIPTGALFDIKFARFRLTPTDSNGQCTATVNPFGFQYGGEVEDYAYNFAQMTAVTMSDAATTSASPITILSLLVLALAICSGAFLHQRVRDH